MDSLSSHLHQQPPRLGRRPPARSHVRGRSEQCRLTRRRPETEPSMRNERPHWSWHASSTCRFSKRGQTLQLLCCHVKEIVVVYNCVIEHSAGSSNNPRKYGP